MVGKRAFVVTALTIFGLVAPATAAMANPISPDGQFGTQSMSRCDGQVCIEINGDDLHVNFINAKVRNTFNHAITTTGTLYKNGSFLHNFGTHTLQPDDFNTYGWNVNEDFTDGDDLCVQWSGVAGYACGEIG